MSSLSNLSEFYREKAEKELGETETKKAQSLEQFRDWIKMQPHIKNCRLDDKFLLRYLRVRKYSILNATKTLEDYLISMKVLPQYYKNVDIEDPILKDIINSGYFLIMPDRTAEGERIILVRPQTFNANIYSSADVFRTHVLGLNCIFEEEETQISGINFIVDFSNLPMNYFGLFKIADYQNIANLVRNCLPLRVKSLILINLPAFSNFLLQFLLKMFNEKLRKRVHSLKNYEELKLLIDVNLLPIEYGGKMVVTEIIESTKKILLERRSSILKISETEVKLQDNPKWALSSCAEIDCGIVGSFRKLEID